MIYHIVEEISWEAQKEDKYYSHPSLKHEGFIHCSQQHQLGGVLERYYKDKKNLLTLSINESMLTSKLKYEEAPSGGLYPHIFGPIDKKAIISIKKIR